MLMVVVDIEGDEQDLEAYLSGIPADRRYPPYGSKTVSQSSAASHCDCSLCCTRILAPLGVRTNRFNNRCISYTAPSTRPAHAFLSASAVSFCGYSNNAVLLMFRRFGHTRNSMNCFANSAQCLRSDISQICAIFSTATQLSS